MQKRYTPLQPFLRQYSKAKRIWLGFAMSGLAYAATFDGYGICRESKFNVPIYGLSRT